jgi:hypothetical protein
MPAWAWSHERRTVLMRHAITFDGRIGEADAEPDLTIGGSGGRDTDAVPLRKIVPPANLVEGGGCGGRALEHVLLLRLGVR